MYGSGKNDTAVQLPKGFDQASVNARLQHYLSLVLPMTRSPCHARKGAITHITRQLWEKPTSAGALCSRHPPTVSSPLFFSCLFSSQVAKRLPIRPHLRKPLQSKHTQQCVSTRPDSRSQCKTTETSMCHVRWGKSSVPLTDVPRPRGDSIQGLLCTCSLENISYTKRQKNRTEELYASFLSPVRRVKKKKHRDKFENVQPLFN